MVIAGGVNTGVGASVTLYTGEEMRPPIHQLVDLGTGNEGTTNGIIGTIEGTAGVILIVAAFVPNRGVVPNNILRSGSGHSYAAEVIEGGTGRAFAGHGEFRLGSGDIVVPQGVEVTMPQMGRKIQDITGQLMEHGDWDGLLALARTNPKVADDLVGMATHLPGSKMPNLTLKAPNGLTIMSASRTVEDATGLRVLIQDAQGNWCWAACTLLRGR